MQAHSQLYFYFQPVHSHQGVLEEFVDLCVKMSFPVVTEALLLFLIDLHNSKTSAARLVLPLIDAQCAAAATSHTFKQMLASVWLTVGVIHRKLLSTESHSLMIK